MHHASFLKLRHLPWHPSHTGRLPCATRASSPSRRQALPCPQRRVSPTATRPPRGQRWRRAARRPRARSPAQQTNPRARSLAQVMSLRAQSPRANRPARLQASNGAQPLDSETVPLALSRTVGAPTLDIVERATSDHLSRCYLPGRHTSTARWQVSAEV